MLNEILPTELPTIIQQLGSLCQVATAIIALAIGIVTSKYTRRQTALLLINQNNTLANLVNSTIIQSEPARIALGKTHNFVVGCPDDAILLMYLNYVHNTYRMFCIRAVSQQVWADTLASCISMVIGLRREQVVALLSRGYEQGFQIAIIKGFDKLRSQHEDADITTLTPRSSRQSHIALVS